MVDPVLPEKQTSDLDRIARLKAVLAKARTLREYHEAEFRECYMLTFPDREGFRHQRGTRVKREQIFDSTATDSAANLVTTTMRLMVPSNDQWCQVELKEEIKKKFPNSTPPQAVTQSIIDWNAQLFGFFEHSSFYLAADEAMHDLVICGTACLAVYGRASSLKPAEFRAIHPEQIFFVEDAHGMPDIVFREHRMSARQLVQRFGDAVLPDEIKREKESTESEGRHKILEIEEPCADGTFQYSVYLDGSDWKSLEEQTYPFRTFIVFRWAKASRDVWGSSQVRQALPIIRTLNRLVELTIANLEYSAFGLWQNADGNIDTKKLRGKLKPGSLINTDGGRLEPVEFPGKFELSATAIAGMQAQVKSLLFDSPLPPTTQNNYLTATEINVRQSEYYRRIGQPALRLEREFLEPVVHWVTKRLVQFGFLNPLPPAVMALLGPTLRFDQLVDVVVTSAIAKVIRVNRAQTNLQAVAQIAQIVGPEQINKIVDQNAFTRETLTDFGLSPELMRTEQEVAAIEKQNQQLQQAQLAATAANQVVDLQSKIKGNETQGLNPGASNNPLAPQAPGNQLGRAA